MENNKRINWIKIGIEVLAIFVFVLLLVWLFPLPGKKNTKATNFGDNFDTFRESARKYYTNNKLPEESEKMTLQQLIDKKAIKPLYDKSGKACDADKSYVRITKINDKEYQLRIDLTCGNESDYVLETITTKEENCTPEEKTENNNNSSSSSSSSYSETKKLTQYRYYKKEIEKVTTYKCEDGYVLNGKTCVKVNDNQIAATAKYSEEKTLTMAPTRVTGATQTIYADVIVTNGNPQYYCEKGTIGADNLCHVNEQTYVSAKENKSTSSYAATNNQTYGNWQFNGSIDVTSTRSSNNTTRYDFKGSYTKNECTTSTVCVNLVTHYKYDVYKRSLNNNYSCPNGGSLSGDRCYTTNTSYYCENGTSPVNKQCLITKNTTYQPTITYTKNYTCPDGYQSTGSGASMVCYKTIKSDDTFYCSDSSYTLDRITNTCYKKLDKQITNYECPTGYTLNGTMCVANKDTKPAKKWTVCTIITSYTWNSKTTLEGWTRTEGTRVIEVK